MGLHRVIKTSWELFRRKKDVLKPVKRRYKGGGLPPVSRGCPAGREEGDGGHI